MASPFNVFRRNQRIMMAILVGLSMFAFIFFDPSIMRGGGGVPKSLTVILIAAVCGLGLWFVGSRRGQGSEWGMWGALLGAVAALLFVRSTGPEKISFGTIQVTENNLRKVANKRSLVNRFVFEAARMAKTPRQVQGFGSTNDEAMFQFLMGRKEVERLGISLTDAAVNRYIREITEDKLSKREFSEILHDLGIGEGDLFNYLREELEVQLAFQIESPPHDNWMDFDLRSGQRFFRPMLRATPEEEWGYFRRLNVKESLSVVALPVSAFVPKVPAPAEQELQLFFEQYKNRPPGAQGEPGFVQPHRVRLAYLAADYEKFERQATPPTDEDVVAYYEANKDLKYRVRAIPDREIPEDVPVDADLPENVTPAFPAPEPPESDEAPADATPDTEASDVKESDGESSAAAASSGIPIRLVSLVTQSEDTESSTEGSETKEPVTEDDSKPADAETGAGEKTESQIEKPAAAENTDDKDDVNDPFPIELPSPGAAEKEPVRYRELDNELKDEIREQILQDRAFEKMGEAVDKAQAEMERLATVYQDAGDEQKPAVAKQISEQLQECAANHGLSYVETELMSQFELQTSATEQIGGAVLSTGNPLQFEATSVVEDLFPRTGQSVPLYLPQRADSRLRTNRYAYWKIEDVPQHAPEWNDKGIKEQVETAWKFEKARELAVQRAETLKELAQQKPDDLAAALSGQTVTGDKGEDAVVIKETPRFSWLTTARTTPDFNFDDFMAPRPSFVDGVDQPGEEFFKTVFDDLKVGEVGVTVNYPHTSVYVVKVQERDGAEPAPTDVEGYQTTDELRKRFLADHESDRFGFASRPYNLIMSNALARLQGEWVKAIDQRYGVQPEEMNAMRSASRQSAP